MLFNTAYHFQTDGWSEHTIQMLEDILCACVLNFGDNWYEYLLLCEFSYNNSYHSNIDMAPYKVLYDRPCRFPTCWNEVKNQHHLGLDCIQETIEKVAIIQKHLTTA